MKDIRDIIPVCIATIHNDLVSYYLETGQDNVTHKIRDMFIKNKKNMLLNVSTFFHFN